MTFEPHPWFGHPHLQTLAGALVWSRSFPVSSRWVTSAHGDRLRLEVCGADGRPRILLLHGLSGSSRSGFIRRLMRLFEMAGWQALALNFRGAGGEIPEVPRLYHAGCSDDLDAVVTSLFPGPPLALAGFSLGANVLLKWLGERGRDLPGSILGACSVCSPLDLASCATRLDTSPLPLYRVYLIGRLKAMARRFLVRHPSVLNGVDLSTIQTFWQFDHRITAPLHGFDDALNYYQRCSSLHFLEHIRVPTRLLNSRDDPFLGPLKWPRGTDWVRPDYPERGGHLGFIGPGWSHWLEDYLMALSREWLPSGP